MFNRGFIRFHLLVAVILLSQTLYAPRGALAHFTPSNGQNATLVLGQPNFTSNAPATSQTGMKRPDGVAVDLATGKVFVADTENDRVLRFASATALANGAAAEAVLGHSDFTTGGYGFGCADAAANILCRPSGLYVDTSGRLWVADSALDRVLRFDNASSKANGANADGVLGQPVFTTSDPAITQSGMVLPGGLFVDSSGRLWVADTFNHRILRFDNAAAKANGANADGVLGQTDFTSKIPATTQNRMSLPGGVYLDSGGRLWVADSANHRVLRFDNATAKANGANADGVLGQINFTSNGSACTSSEMMGPRSVTKDYQGRLYVSDGGHRILIFEASATYTNGSSANNVLGQTNFTTCSENTGGISASTLNLPQQIFYDAAARVLWVTEYGNNRVLMYGVPGQIATIVLGQTSFTSNAAATTQTGMFNPYGVAVDPTTGKIFVSDRANHRVLRFPSASSLTDGMAAEGVLGQADFTSGFANRGDSAAAYTMWEPCGLSVDSSGRLWVADILNNRVLRFDNASTKANGANADGVLGQLNFNNNDYATSQYRMYLPIDVFADSDGRLWVADRYNNRVLRFDNAATKTYGDYADVVLGQPNFTSNAAATSQNGMYFPNGLFVDSGGRLWVAEVGNSRVLRFDNAATKTSGANADGVLGQPNFTSYGYACTQSGMNVAHHVSVDLGGSLYVTDFSNNRILIFAYAAELPNGSAADRLIGQTNFTTCTPNTGGISAKTLNLPTYALYDAIAKVLWVADWGNNRVLVHGAPFRLYIPLVRK